MMLRNLALALPLTVVAALPLGMITGCASRADADTAESTSGDSESALRTGYADLYQTLSPADLDRWVALKASLQKGFDDICGDTICSGDYSNLATVSLSCSSTQATKKLKDCEWVLGGSIESVDGATGAISSLPRVFSCKVPVASTAIQMLDALSAAGDASLRTPLPGTSKSFYDALTDCFAGVVGPLPAPPTGTKYKGFEGALSNDADWGAWSEIQQGLAKGFDDVCGDTFCEGDFSDIVGLRFSCAANAKTARISGCSWSFAEATSSLDSRGTFKTETAVKVCPVKVSASAATFLAALHVADPLHAKLPGRQTSIYDALVGCL